MTKTSELCPIPAGLDKRIADNIRSKHIELDADDMAKGRTIAASVTAAVETLAALGKLPPLLSGRIFCGGSFGRRTQAKPLDDIDLFIPLDAKALTLESPGHVPTAEQLVMGNAPLPLGCRQDLHCGPWLDSGHTLDSAVAGLHGIQLAARDIGKNPRGRCAHLTYLDVNVDLVFVLWSQHPDIDRYHLPSGAGWTWRTANPKDDQERLSQDNQNRHNQLLLPTIRTLKGWNDHACAGRLKGIHLEVLALERIFATVEIDSVVSAVTYALGQLPAALATSCPDPTGLGPDLDSALDSDDRAWVIQQAQTDAARADAANIVGRTDLAGATNLWAALLLTDGPPAPDRGPRAAPQPGWHHDQFGQPAHHCADSAAIPPPKADYRPAVAVNQQGRSGKYA